MVCLQGNCHIVAHKKFMEYTAGISERVLQPVTLNESKVRRKVTQSHTSLDLGHMCGEYVPQGENEALRHSSALSRSSSA